ncbi:MAG: 30S ribosome-binding factor RbfA [Clostridia bacterium]|nr:30S ribosome-binding factor RbfA [Clostridia bacterium]
MGKGHRAERLGEEIRKIISTMLLRELKDPALSGMISITAVKVTSDGSYANVFVNEMSSKDAEADDEHKQEVLAGFERAKGLIKREIGKQVKLRHVPELIFKWDSSMEYGRKMSKILDSLHIEDYADDEETDDLVEENDEF